MNLNNGTINVTGSVIHNNFTLGRAAVYPMLPAV